MRSTRVSQLQTDKLALSLVVRITLLKIVLFATNQEKILQWTNNYSQLKPAADLYNSTYGQQTERIQYRILLVVDVEFKYIPNAI